MSDAAVVLQPEIEPVRRESVRTVVVGYGMAGRQFHAYLVERAPGLALHGVVVRDPEKRARLAADRPQARTYDTIGDACADPDVDLVVLATPNSTHADLAVTALRAGKHVVTDKVMALSLEECDRMLAAACDNRRLLAVFQNRRFDGDFLTVKQLIESGEIGEPRYVEMAWQGFGAWGGWRGKAEMGGGRFYDLGAHLFDQALALFPESVEHVYCRMHHDYAERDIESEALAVVAFEGGRTAVCDLSGMTAISKPRFLVHGTKATFQKFGLDPQEEAMKAGDIDAAVEAEANYGRLKGPDVDRVVPTLPGRWRGYYEQVARALLGGAPPPVTHAEMRRVMAVLDAALVSARTGESVRPGV